MNRLSTPMLLVPGLVAALLLAACAGDEPAKAEVNGQTYAVGPVRGLRISEAHLQYFGTVGNTNAGDLFLNGEVFTLDEVDVQTLLLVRAVPALAEDPDDAWGGYIGLWGGGEDADLCRYAEASAVTFCE
jgi:hypothetical protein